MSFKKYLTLRQFGNAEWTQQQSIKMLLTNCMDKGNKNRMLGRWGALWLINDMGENNDKQVKSNLPEVMIAAFMGVMYRELNGNDNHTTAKSEISFSKLTHTPILLNILYKYSKHPICFLLSCFKIFNYVMVWLQSLINLFCLSW
jgi:hypothetical protein